MVRANAHCPEPAPEIVRRSRLRCGSGDPFAALIDVTSGSIGIAEVEIYVFFSQRQFPASTWNFFTPDKRVLCTHDQSAINGHRRSRALLTTHLPDKHLLQQKYFAGGASGVHAMCGLSLELAQRLSRVVTSFLRVVRTAIPVMVPSVDH
jgi:hypothetical protein